MQANAHDALFKSAFGTPEHATGELRTVLPPRFAARLDLATLALEPGSFVDDQLKERQSDLLYSVATGAGRTVLVYLLLEHQSTVDELMAFRLLRYLVRIWERYVAMHPSTTRLPIIVPVVLHHSEDGWTAGTAFEDLLDVDAETLAPVADHVPRFRFLLDDISHATDEDLRSRAMTAFGRLVLWCLRHAREPNELIDRLSDWLGVVRQVRNAANGPDALQLILRYILATNEPKRRPEDVIDRLLAAMGDEGKEDVMTAAEMLLDQGRREGEQKGRREGEQKGRREGELKGELKGKRTMLLTLLAARFGALPDAAVARINAADLAQLDVWAERVLTEPTLADVLGK
jgi:predicted transposase YdaD